MGKSRLRVSSRKKMFTLATLAVLAIAALALSAAALVRPLGSDHVEDTPSVKYTSSPHEEPERVEITEAMSRLDDPERPFTIAILGDSTGAERDAWPTLIGEWFSEEYDRPVALFPWSENEPVGYRDARNVGVGTNAPVTIYNGSAPGRRADYAYAKLGEFIPADLSTVDLILVSHGHNHPAGTLANPVYLLAQKFDRDAPQAALGLIIQNPQIPESHRVEIHRANVMNVKLYADRSSRETIDVRQAYLDFGDFGSLYKDNVHPDGEAGYRIWADTVIAVLSAD